jgi:hypothetical protein
MAKKKAAIVAPKTKNAYKTDAQRKEEAASQLKGDLVTKTAERKKKGK